MMKFLTSLALSFLMLSCVNDLPPRSSGATPNDDIWLIPKGLVRGTGLDFDAIPALENPTMIDAEEVDYLNPEDLVIGFYTGHEYRAYPHKILDWHEIINDRDEELQFSINYCPLTGSGLAWDLYVNGKFSTYGVSGLLYNSNLMLYDRRTESIWPQMLVKCVNGENIGNEPTVYPVVETTWSTWQRMYPKSKVVSTETGFVRPYDVYPYIEPLTQADYRVDPFLMFRIEHDDERLHRKERVLGLIINEEAKVYRFSSFGDEPTLIKDSFMSEEIVVIGSNDLNIIFAFGTKTMDGTSLDLEILPDSMPNILTDNEGNVWDIFGYATAGPRLGERLATPTSYMGYWFAFGAFFENAGIYE